MPYVHKAELAGNSMELLDMDDDPCGRSILVDGWLARFAAAQDADYEPIRRMARQAERVLLT
jgi:hypothetical protein